MVVLDLRYQLIRLLRSWSANAMGPHNRELYQDDQPGWDRKWQDWASKP